MSVYLDYNASSPIDKRVLDYMVDVYASAYGNSDSRTHDFGDKARQIVEDARKQVAQLLNCSTAEVFFTSGSTESSNIAILGLEQYANEVGKKHIVTTSIEHKAILGATDYLKTRGFSVDYVDPDTNGAVRHERILEAVKEDTVLVSVMHVNNETGVIQPVDRLGKALKEKGVLFHVDATQSCGKLVDELQALEYDMLSISAHKLCGPQGVGGLVLRRNNHRLPPIKPIMFGGQQEHGIRPGTVPVAQVAGLGKACEIARLEYSTNAIKCKKIQEGLIHCLEESGLDFCINGDLEIIVPNTLNVCIKGVSSEALMIATKQFCGVSNGSACTSKDYSPSHVLKAMGMADEDVFDSIRISWGANQEEKDITESFKELLSVAKTMV